MLSLGYLEGKNISVIPENDQFEHFWWKSIRESCQKIRRILGFGRNLSEFEDLYLRAQEELKSVQYPKSDPFWEFGKTGVASA